jgi:hypothetical protein
MGSTSILRISLSILFRLLMQHALIQLRRYKGTTDLQLERISVYYVSALDS